MALSLTDHTISLSHLLNEETSWNKFYLVGVSGRDGLLYIVGSTPTHVVVFTGNPLLPNSWKLTNRYILLCSVMFFSF